MAKFRISDLWWDDRSIGGRIALAWSRRRNGRLHGRRSYVRQPATYDTLVKGYADGLLFVLITLAKVAVGLFAAAAMIACGLLVYAIV